MTLICERFAGGFANRSLSSPVARLSKNSPPDSRPPHLAASGGDPPPKDQGRVRRGIERGYSIRSAIAPPLLGAVATEGGGGGGPRRTPDARGYRHPPRRGKQVRAARLWPEHA